ncbi:hypothetical protein B0H11DRAFT_1899561 [Mycena galericulata]|nr:hypothetical protein B0H11DRAFT_1899561 [Mycena galericulata]
MDRREATENVGGGEGSSAERPRRRELRRGLGHCANAREREDWRGCKDIAGGADAEKGEDTSPWSDQGTEERHEAASLIVVEYLICGYTQIPEQTRRSREVIWRSTRMTRTPLSKNKERYNHIIELKRTLLGRAREDLSSATEALLQQLTSISVQLHRPTQFLLKHGTTPPEFAILVRLQTTAHTLNPTFFEHLEIARVSQEDSTVKSAGAQRKGVDANPVAGHQRIVAVENAAVRSPNEDNTTSNECRVRRIPSTKSVIAWTYSQRAVFESEDADTTIPPLKWSIAATLEIISQGTIQYMTIVFAADADNLRSQNPDMGGTISQEGRETERGVGKATRRKRSEAREAMQREEGARKEGSGQWAATMKVAMDKTRRRDPSGSREGDGNGPVGIRAQESAQGTEDVCISAEKEQGGMYRQIHGRIPTDTRDTQERQGECRGG